MFTFCLMKYLVSTGSPWIKWSKTMPLRFFRKQNKDCHWLILKWVAGLEFCRDKFREPQRPIILEKMRHRIKTSACLLLLKSHTLSLEFHTSVRYISYFLISVHGSVTFLYPLWPDSTKQCSISNLKDVEKKSYC